MFPTLEGTQLKLDEVPLPSAFLPLTIADQEYRRWVNYEFDIRVGMGHDYLEELRQAVGLNHYIYRRQQKNARGLKEMQKVSKQQADTSRKKGLIISNYIHNWSQISSLLMTGHVQAEFGEDRLKGLKPLDSKRDVTFFEEWGAQAASYMGHRDLNVSWIWRIAMEGQPSHLTIQGSEIKKLTDSWESEGTMKSTGFLFAAKTYYSTKTSLVTHIFKM